MSLRPYQAEMVDGIAREFRRGRRRVLAVLPTGAGKTHVFGHIATRTGAATARVLIVAHRRELVSQAEAKLHELGALPGIRVGTVQSLVRRAAEPADLIILDEAHHSVAGQWRALLAAHPNARVIGFTATPLRLDGRGLGDVFDSMVTGPGVADLIEQGYLVPSVVYGPEAAPDTRALVERGGDFGADAVAALMDQPPVTGDAVRCYTEIASGRTAIAFCASVEHSRHVAAEFDRAGIWAVPVYGAMPAKEREAAFFALRAGAVRVVTSCDLISEGLDVPSVGAVILLRPTQSLGMYLQMVGRGMRPDAGKSDLVVLDHAGNVFRHGLPGQPREWSLAAGRPKSATPAIRQCPSCYAIHAPAPQCIACGHVYSAQDRATRTLRRADGSLVEITESDWRLSTLPLRELVSKARTHADLCKIRDARGYAENWPDVAMRYKKNFRPAASGGSEFFA